MKTTPDQKVTAYVVAQIMKNIGNSPNIDSDDFYSYLASELHTLDEIVTEKERIKLEDLISEIYLLIKNHKE